MNNSGQQDISKPKQLSIEGSRLLYIIHSQGRDVKRMPPGGNILVTLRKPTIITQNLLLFVHV
jgi:hypothetical protein